MGRIGTTTIEAIQQNQSLLGSVDRDMDVGFADMSELSDSRIQKNGCGSKPMGCHFEVDDHPF